MMKLFPLLAASQPDRIAFAELAMIGPAMYGAGVVAGLMFWGFVVSPLHSRDLGRD